MEVCGVFSSHQGAVFAQALHCLPHKKTAWVYCAVCDKKGAWSRNMLVNG